MNGELAEAEAPKKTPKRGRKKDPGEMTNGEENAESVKKSRRHANSKPSYSMKRGVGTSLSYRGEYKKRLRTLLKKLILRHNWAEASGVLAVLLKASTKDKSSRNMRFEYWAAMQILSRTEGGNTFKMIEGVYDTWTMKARVGKERLAVHTEYMLYCLTQRQAWNPYFSAIVEDPDSERDPFFNLVVGLTFYQLWYDKIPQKWKLNDTDGSIQSGFHDVESQGTIFSTEWNSVTSVANDKENMEEVDDNLQTQSSQQTHSHDGYEYSTSGSSSPAHGGLFASIFQSPCLPPWLLPIKIPPRKDINKEVLIEHSNFQNDFYMNAVKHLRVALHSTPPMAEALEPLIQVLLMGDRVNEALHEIDNFCDDSGTLLKLRLKIGLLEHFDRGNHLELSSCYEEILNLDPRSSNSLVKLIDMHEKGYYRTEKLVQMLGLSLDATFPEFNIWKELASSLIDLSQCVGDDEMSTTTNGKGEEIKLSYTAPGHSYQIPELFRDGESGKTWRFRCRWWLTRHFSSSMLAEEIESGEFQLITYKAAVAAFLYGPHSKYLTRVTEVLGNQTAHQDLYSVLRIHAQRYVGICKQ